MKKILVTYATLAGATVEVARAVGEELTTAGWPVEVLPLQDVRDLSQYRAVVIGAPMIMGWHRAALGFLRRHRRELQRLPVAVFALAMSLTEPDAASVDGVPVQLDAQLPKPPVQPARLTFRERFTQLDHYLRPIVAALRPAQPVALGLFGGRLEYGRLPWWAVLFAMLVIQAPAGEKRNWPFIRAWAASLPAAFEPAAPQRAAVA